MTDYARDEIAQLADRAITRNGGPEYCRVYFKFTCEACGARCTFDEPNTLFARGECHECGHQMEITHAGFALHVGVMPTEIDHGKRLSQSRRQ